MVRPRAEDRRPICGPTRDFTNHLRSPRGGRLGGDNVRALDGSDDPD